MAGNGNCLALPLPSQTGLGRGGGGGGARGGGGSGNVLLPTFPPGNKGEGLTAKYEQGEYIQLKAQH